MFDTLYPRLPRLGRVLTPAALITAGATLLLSLSAFGVLLMYGVTFQLEAAEVQRLGDGPPVDLFFTPSGDLVLLNQHGTSVHMSHWETGTSVRQVNPPTVLDLADFVDPSLRDTIRINPSSPAVPPQGGSSENLIAYTASHDGTKLAWAWSGTLYIFDTADADNLKQPATLTLNRSQFVTGISFNPGDLITVVFDDGTLEVWNHVKGKRRASVPLQAAWPILTRGEIVTLASFPTAEIARFRVRPPLRSFNWTLIPLDFNNGSTLAVSSADEMVIGRRDGAVVRLAENEGEAEPVVDLEGEITSLAYYVDDQTVFAGTTSGIYLLEEAKSPRLLTAAEPIHQLAVAENFLAYITEEEARVAEVKERPKLLSTGTVVMTVFPILLALISLAHPLLHDWFTQRQNTKSGQEDAH